MQELEKILEEIDIKIAGSMGKKREGILEAREIIRKHMNDGWIPVEKAQPEEDGFYIATMDGEIVGQEETFVGLAEFENGKWIDDEEDYKCVIAWRPLPEPYKPKQPETCKYTGGSCCWPIDQCSDCPNNPERSEKTNREAYERDCNELEQYREIGTVEECRKAVEKQKAKKPDIYTDTRNMVDLHGNVYAEQANVYLCPTCESFIGYVGNNIFHYCPVCGQAIEENLEGMEDE